ncbi:PilZ domain-containing protein [Thiohalorhabdus sp.]|uniref:PilZ domain-containing protein n=1 Tax=Thiohalorhabdus sp. TaxID=3094134 RepID=UPI002FC2DDA1
MTANRDPTVPALLAGLAALSDAGRRTSAPETVVAILERTSERIRYLAGVTGETGDEAGPIRAPNPTSADELPGALGTLIEEGAEAGAPAWATNLLATAHIRLGSELTGSSEGAENRLAPRLQEDLAARLVRADGSELAVLVLDRSPLGLGLFAEQPVDPHELVRLNIDSPAADEQHRGEVIFCLERGDAFHIGVELLATE